jgi:hypothetical protein
MGKSVFRLELTGRDFGRWSVLSFHGKNAIGELLWNCRCECGTERVVKAGSLMNGRSRSCGCFHKSRVSTHGMTGTPTFKSWDSMKQRCTNPKAPDFARYGGRGVRVCGRWLESFENFLHDMGARPTGQTLDRVDVNGDYTPENCRWATMSQQQRNKRTSSVAEFGGVTRTYAEWAEITGVNSKAIGERLRRGWAVKDALLVPLGERRQ